MPFFPSVLRPALLTATVAGVTAVTVLTSSQAEASRPKVRDHRRRRCGGNPNGGSPICS
jgi:hypothetical protein